MKQVATDLDPRTATAPEMELWLAGLEVEEPCKNPYCQDCAGTGKLRVPRFPELREGCTNCSGTGAIYMEPEVHLVCGVCKGRKWLPKVTLEGLLDAIPISLLPHKRGGYNAWAGEEFRAVYGSTPLEAALRAAVKA